MSAAAHEEQVVSVLILGNSGSGKSFLSNCLLESSVFAEGDDSMTAVTTKSSFVEFSLPVSSSQTMRLRVFDVPGLYEQTVEETTRNIAQLKHAFELASQHNATPTSSSSSSSASSSSSSSSSLPPQVIVLFVLRVPANYLNVEDVAVFRLLEQTLFTSLASSSSSSSSSSSGFPFIGFIANELNEQLPAQFEEELTLRLKEMIGWSSLPSVSFVSRLPSHHFKPNEEDGQIDYAQPAFQRIRTQLLLLLFQLQPSKLSASELSSLSAAVPQLQLTHDIVSTLKSKLSNLGTGKLNVSDAQLQECTNTRKERELKAKQEWTNKQKQVEEMIKSGGGGGGECAVM